MSNYYGRPLHVAVVKGVLTIQIGVEALAHAVTYADWANPYDEVRYDYIRTFAIADPKAFAKDVVNAMEREREDGSTPLTDFIDTMTEAALDDGSMACEYEQIIPHGTNSPLETWASAQEKGK